MLAAAISIVLLFDGPIPWPVPVLPIVPTSSAPTVELDEIEHAAEYEDRQTEMETMVDDWTAPLVPISDAFEDFIPTVPDASTGDFNLTYAPFSDFNTAFEFADYAGESVGTLMQYVRAGQDVAINIMPTIAGSFINFMLACSLWLVLVKLLVIVVEIVKFIVSGVFAVWNAFFNVAPTGG
jgi:hypothetical protein